MKKYLSFALAAALSAAFCATAFAAEDNRQVKVETHIAPTYNVTIPANTKVISKAEDTPFGAITLTDAQLDPGKSVNVTLKSSGTLKNKNDTSKMLAYTIRSGESAFTSASYTKGRGKHGPDHSYCEDDWAKAYAGDYADTVEFTISYK
mgnify:CR=1 FL=1